MKENNDEERIERACKLMDSKGLTQGEQFSVIGAFRDFFKYDYPFITEKNGKFYSEHEPIKSFQFNSENEVILANAIYESTKDNFNPNEFIQMLKYVMRVIME